MKIFRAENPQVVELIYPTLAAYKGEEFKQDINGSETISEMAIRLLEEADETCLMVVIDGETLLAYCYGYLIKERPWAWIELAWSKADTPHQQKMECFDRFCDWAASCGKTEIRAETEIHNFETWKRAYGFDKQAIIIKKDLTHG